MATEAVRCVSLPPISSPPARCCGARGGLVAEQHEAVGLEGEPAVGLAARDLRSTNLRRHSLFHAARPKMLLAMTTFYWNVSLRARVISNFRSLVINTEILFISMSVNARFNADTRKFLRKVHLLFLMKPSESKWLKPH